MCICLNCFSKQESLCSSVLCMVLGIILSDSGKQCLLVEKKLATFLMQCTYKSRHIRALYGQNVLRHRVKSTYRENRKALISFLVLLSSVDMPTSTLGEIASGCQLPCLPLKV